MRPISIASRRAALCASLLGAFLFALVLSRPALGAPREEGSPSDPQEEFSGPALEHGRHPGDMKMGEHEHGGKGCRDERGGHPWGMRHRMFEFGAMEHSPYAAVRIAAFGIIHDYKEMGKAKDAAPVLEEMLKTAKDQKARNILLISIAHVYSEEKDFVKAAEVNKQLMREALVSSTK